MILLSLSSSDALALSLLGTMFITLMAVGSLIIVMIRNVQKRDAQQDELDKLLHEISEEEKEQKLHSGKEDQPPTHDWEKEPDWWKS